MHSWNTPSQLILVADSAAWIHLSEVDPPASAARDELSAKANASHRETRNPNPRAKIPAFYQLSHMAWAAFDMFARHDTNNAI